MSADSPIIKKELREYVDILGYSESELLKKNREETKNSSRDYGDLRSFG